MGIFKVTSRFGLLLGFIALLCTAISAGIYMLTKDRIDEAMAEQQKALLLQVIPQNIVLNTLFYRILKAVFSIEPDVPAHRFNKLRVFFKRLTFFQQLTVFIVIDVYHFYKQFKIGFCRFYRERVRKSEFRL